MPTWKDITGEEKDIKELETSHLKNILRLAKRKLAKLLGQIYGPNQTIETKGSAGRLGVANATFEAIRKELKKRGETITPDMDLHQVRTEPADQPPKKGAFDPREKTLQEKVKQIKKENTPPPPRTRDIDHDFEFY